MTAETMSRANELMKRIDALEKQKARMNECSDAWAATGETPVATVSFKYGTSRTQMKFQGEAAKVVFGTAQKATESEIDQLRKELEAL